MKKLSLEYRVRKLEKAILEDAIDDELDKMSNDIEKTMPDIEDDLDKMSDDIVKNTPEIDVANDADKDADYIVSKDKSFKFNTVDEYVQDIVYSNVDWEVTNVDLLTNLKKYLLQFNSFKSIKKVNEIKKDVKEISQLSYFKAKKLLVAAIDKAIKVEMDHYQNCVDHFVNFAKEMKIWVRNDLKKRFIADVWYVDMKITDDFKAYFEVYSKWDSKNNIVFWIDECRPTNWHKFFRTIHKYNITMKKDFSSLCDFEGKYLSKESLIDKYVKEYFHEVLIWRIENEKYDNKVGCWVE